MYLYAMSTYGEVGSWTVQPREVIYNPADLQMDNNHSSILPEDNRIRRLVILWRLGPK